MPENRSSRYSIDDFDAVILDLDGVITKTAEVHANAWKRMFDQYLEKKFPGDDSQKPFDVSDDYGEYVDGKPRYDGVRSFLASRGIELPEGDPSDPEDRETICGLGNRKNKIFLEILHEQGAEVYEDAVHQVRKWRMRGLKTAVVSSSSNCAEVLEVAGLSDLFDVRVDGVVARELELEGKPAADTFLEAARELGVDPSRALVFEDAIAGVRAGRRGDFGLVVGVARRSAGKELREGGADVVVHSLLELRLTGSRTSDDRRDPGKLSSALDSIEEITRRLQGKRLACFLDYDGTLTPIVSEPDLAKLSESMRSTLKKLASLCTVAIVSGRDRNDVEKLVRLDELIYAGSHGFDISGPDGLRMELKEAQELLSDFDAAESELAARLESTKGTLVERKRYSVAVHYRNVAEEDIAGVEKRVDEVLQNHGRLTKERGKKIFELRPNLDWDKGDAVLWALEALGLDDADVLPLYLGDDLTDEDAFRALADRGVAVVVGSPSRPTYARYSLRDPSEVERFLLEMVQRLQKENTR